MRVLAETQWECESSQKPPSPQNSACTEPRHSPLLKPVLCQSLDPTGTNGSLQSIFSSSRSFVALKRSRSVQRVTHVTAKVTTCLITGKTCGQVLPLCCQPTAAACWCRGKTMYPEASQSRSKAFAPCQAKEPVQDNLRCSLAQKVRIGSTHPGPKAPAVPDRSTPQGLRLCLPQHRSAKQDMPLRCHLQ